MQRGPAYTDNELIILTLLALIVTTIVVGIIGFAIRRIYRAPSARRRPPAATSRIEPA